MNICSFIMRTERFKLCNPQVMYGGRAIDDFDRRVLKTYMDEYMGDFIFDTFQPFHFYHNEEVDYKIPEDGSRDNYTGKKKALQMIMLKV